MGRDIAEWCKACLECQKNKIHRHTKSAIGDYPLPSCRFSHINVDVVGPLPTSCGFSYVLTCVDRFSRWPEAFPMVDQTAATIAETFFAGWISRFGVPECISTDQGRSFESDLCHALMKFLGTEKFRTTAYNPASNGLVERFHRQLKQAIRCQATDKWVQKVMESWEAFEIWSNKVWLVVYEMLNGDEIILNVVVPVFLMITVYWSVSCIFTLVDLSGKPHFIVKFRIPDMEGEKYPRLTEVRLRAVSSQVLFNQTAVAIPFIIFSFILRSNIGYEPSHRLPKFHTFVFDMVVQILTEEVFFYYSHRLLHHPLLYRRFHKRHHEWKSPVAVSAIYCHPVEHIASNVLPTVMGSVVAGSHVISLWVWLTFTTTYGVIVHSGYHLPLTPTPEFHHYHHNKFNENFGVAGILDWFHGTDKEFRKSQAFQRNKVLLSTTPLT
ncbi:hypothetical protein JTE90_013096 [Oedothorax gibbosus]|uniref:Integrase catalytic domain-containing protein n=1 Tax=Oedothorax gibbosus TaxID=931172 RepID=A0AAV6UKM8_9ARAC|nr:hypothetical protein JTE90_013096 [Oedothorax gibbosus]